jgi:hypothetical protein
MFWNEHYYFKYLEKIMQILMKVYFTWSQLCRATPNLVDLSTVQYIDSVYS